MKKRILILSLLLLVVTTGFSVPAKRGVWKILSFGGTPTRAQLMGDEHLHYWQTADGLQLTERNGQFELADMESLTKAAQKRRSIVAQSRQRRAAQNTIGDFMHYSGQKKGLVILVGFTNMQFQAGNDSLLFSRICNEENFTEGKFRGSVYDYFKAQSYGEFELTFDVMGPVQMDHEYQYYGTDVGGEGNDAHAGEMVAKACQAVDSLVNFSDYDWDGDGTVDQVLVIYAGRGQADGGGSKTIWPHEWVLEESDYGKVLTLDNVDINTYAVANERSASGINGIGTICHEFSHCLGIPDMYDTRERPTNFGMSSWSLMDSGSYNGDGFCPPDYSSFERYSCGWVNPILLKSDTVIKDIQPLSHAPETYMVRNDTYPNEYFLLENRQKTGWDSSLPGSGMLIIYVDYDRNQWQMNQVNSTPHQRCTLIRPNRSTSIWASAGDAYPYNGLDSLTNTSSPAATLYHPNTDGSKLLNKGILDIAQGSDGTMSFRFRNTSTEAVTENALFCETFNDCAGSGGNDGNWGTNIASSGFVADNKGWDVVKAYGGWMCARFGNASTAGKATTPVIELPDTLLATGEHYGSQALLTFKAAAWHGDGTTLRLSVEGECTIEPDTVVMEPACWTDCSVTLKGMGPIRVTFSPEHRFLLDDVKVKWLKTNIPDAIVTLRQGTTTPMSVGYYHLDGRFASLKANGLPSGLYLRIDEELHCAKVFIK